MLPPKCEHEGEDVDPFSQKVFFFLSRIQVSENQKYFATFTLQASGAQRMMGMQRRMVTVLPTSLHLALLQEKENRSCQFADAATFPSSHHHTEAYELIWCQPHCGRSMEAFAPLALFFSHRGRIKQVLGRLLRRTTHPVDCLRVKRRLGICLPAPRRFSPPPNPFTLNPAILLSTPSRCLRRRRTSAHAHPTLPPHPHFQFPAESREPTADVDSPLPLSRHCSWAAS